MKYLPFEIFNSVWSALEDVIIWMLPIPVVWGLKVSAHRKMGLYFLLLVSLIAVICAIARLTVTIIWIRSVDISWNYPLIPFLSNTEACIGIITSSVPAIQPLFRGPLKQQRIESTTPLYKRNPSVRKWNGQDSETVVSSKADEGNGQKGGSWSLLTQLKKASTGLNAIRKGSQSRLPMFNMEPIIVTTGARTELKDLEEDQDVELVPGLAGEKALRMK